MIEFLSTIIREEKTGRVLILSVRGDLNAHTSGNFEKHLIGAIDVGADRIAVDASELGYISSAGLRVVLTACKILNGRKGKLCFFALTEPVRDIFELSGFGGVVTFFPDRAAAEAFCNK
jgi:anti-anti-sigma factor